MRVNNLLKEITSRSSIQTCELDSEGDAVITQLLRLMMITILMDEYIDNFQ